MPASLADLAAGDGDAPSLADSFSRHCKRGSLLQLPPRTEVVIGLGVATGSTDTDFSLDVAAPDLGRLQQQLELSLGVVGLDGRIKAGVQICQIRHRCRFRVEIFRNHVSSPGCSRCSMHLASHYPTTNYRLPSSASFTRRSASLFCSLEICVKTMFGKLATRKL